jgi:glutaminyl-tRNA synthetase
VKGTIHWVSATAGIPVKAMLYDTLVLDAPETEDGVEENPNSLITKDHAIAEPFLQNAAPGEAFQFLRMGYFCRDPKSDGLVFNRTVTLKNGFKK